MGRRLDEVERRLDAVEQRLADVPSAAAGASAPSEEEPLWVLRSLQQNLAGRATSGALVFAGTWTPGETADAVQWQYGLSTDTVLGWDWSELAPTLAAVGNPVRLDLLRRILTGTNDTASLAATEGLGTSGQLHHHLRILVSAGWLRSPGRGHYEVPGSRIIPLLVLMTAAEDR